MTYSSRARNSVATAVAATLVLARYASAADAPAGPAVPSDASSGEKPSLEEIVVTGSRIHREAADITTNEPLNTVSAQTLTDRGYTQAGEALNALTAVAPSNPVTLHDGTSSGNGQQFPNLFNLGAGRTLTLVNGRRFVNSGAGLGDSVVIDEVSGECARCSVVE